MKYTVDIFTFRCFQAVRRLVELICAKQGKLGQETQEVRFDNSLEQYIQEVLVKNPWVNWLDKIFHQNA